VQYKDVVFSDKGITCTRYVCSGTRKDNGKGIVWGNDRCKQVSGFVQYKDVVFSDKGITCPGYFWDVCLGTRKDNGKGIVWGSDFNKQVSGLAEYKDIVFGGKGIQCSVKMCSGTDKDTGSTKSWGPGKQKIWTKYENTVFETIFTGEKASHMCGVVKGGGLKCWGLNHAGEATVPPTLKIRVESSCRTEHPERTGPTACTTCGKGINHTIIDPRTNTGTCTKTECPFCKPKACCGEKHKHYVVNSESLEGVCVRHSDDCTPVCVPRGNSEPWRQRVCSKGCNQQIKVDKTGKLGPTHGSDNSQTDGFELVVCQADKRIVCEGDKSRHDRLGEATSAGQDSRSCTQEKEVVPVAICNFTVPLWNLGGTCISNMLDGLEFPNCPDKTSLRYQAVGKNDIEVSAFISQQCRNATDAQMVDCSSSSLDAADQALCDASKVEIAHCTRLAMSY